MAKKYVPMQRSSLKYKLYVQDIKKIHRTIQKQLPAIPNFYLAEMAQK